MKTWQRLWLYLTLTICSFFFLFPFFWVIVSSVKSRECMNMIPPAVFPAKLRTREVTLTGPTVGAAGSTWFLLTRSREVFGQQQTPGGYYLQIEHNQPTALVKWFSDSQVTRLKENVRVVFQQAAIHRLQNRQEIILLATMVRQKNGQTEETIFFSPVEEPEKVRSGYNLQHTEIRDLFLRWNNFRETLRGPEATFGEKSIGFTCYLRNSFFISFVAVIGQLLASSLVAYGFARLRFPGRDSLFVLLLASFMIPGQVTMIPLFFIYKSLGWMDSFLPLTVPHFAGSAFNIFLLRQYMLTLPLELDEAASIDGCNCLQIFRHIILPNCTPILIVIGLFTFVGTWQDVMGPLIYLDNPSHRTVTLGLEYFRSPYVDNRHLLMTGVLLSMLPVTALFLIFQRAIMSGAIRAGIKG
ncbi:MAG TPA: carbohydrate ABC transporter permease [bacterium]|nr:carbohydrate ABC transporter permease [bacterium]HOL67338.1 carbohydrate ABC transporter permease [bacterium]HPP11720.1 carbohydrate ABC transporter permease [bacterium]